MFEPVAQRGDRAAGTARIVRGAKMNKPHARVGLDAMAQLHRFGVGQPDDRGGMEALADVKPLARC